MDRFIDRLNQEVEVITGREYSLEDGLRLGNIYKLLLENDKAVECYSGLLEQEPANMPALLNLAEALAHSCRYDDAEARYKEALDREDSAVVRLSIGDIYRARGEYEQAKDAYQEARESYEKKFSKVIMFDSTPFNPARERLEEIESIISSEDTGEKMAKEDFLARHITKPLMLNNPVIMKEVMARNPGLIAVNIDLDSPPELTSSLFVEYASYIESYPLDPYAVETAARMANVLGLGDGDEMWPKAYGIYSKGYHIGEKIEETRHRIQLALRLEKVKEVKEAVNFLSDWNPIDPLLALI